MNAGRRFLFSLVILIITFNCMALLAQQAPIEAYAAVKKQLEKMQNDVLNSTGFYKDYVSCFGIENKKDILTAFIGEPFKSIRLSPDGMDSLSSSGDNLLQYTEFKYYVFPVLYNNDVKFMIRSGERGSGIWRWVGAGCPEVIDKQLFAMRRGNAHKDGYECYYLWIMNYLYALIDDEGEYYIIPANPLALNLLQESILLDQSEYILPAVRFSDALPFIKEGIALYKKTGRQL